MIKKVCFNKLFNFKKNILTSTKNIPNSSTSHASIFSSSNLFYISALTIWANHLILIICKLFFPININTNIKEFI